MLFNRSSKHLLPIAIASAALLFAGCSKKVEVASDSHAPATHSTAPSTAPVTDNNMAARPSTNSVFFAFDRSELDAASRATLDGYAAWLNANASTSITVEGNCDERGSREYNLALGQRRADSIRDYLTAQGVSASRVDTVSFGEERPKCNTSGEACWAENRRGDIVTR